MSRDLVERLVENLHTAALDSDVWPEALDTVARFVGADAVILGIHDITAPIGVAGSRFVAASGLAPRALDEFRRRFVHPETNVLVRKLSTVPEATPVPRHRLQDTATYRNSDIYKTILKPAGYDSVVFGCACVRDGMASPVSFLRRGTRRDFDTPAIARIAEVLPHLRRAMRTAIHLHQERMRRDQAEAALDAMTVPIAIVTPERSLLSANRSMQEWLQLQSPLATRHGRLHARDPRTDAALAKVLHRMRGAGVRLGAPAELAIPPGPQGPSATLTLTALPTDGWQTDRGEIVVTITSAPAARAALTTTIPAAYCLTPRETALVHALVEAGNLAEAAQRLGMKVVTARNHLKRIFSKTDTRSQVELVRLVLTGGARHAGADAAETIA